MKIKTILNALLLSSIFSFGLTAQCSITNLEVLSLGCDINGMVSIQYDFDVVDPGSDNTFTLFVNGGFAGEIEYGQGPYTYGLLWGDCDITHSIQIEDSNDSSCSADFTFAEPFCCWEEGCNMVLDVDSVGECNSDGDFYITLLVANPGGSSGGFETVINGVSFGWTDYGSPLYEFGPLDGDCETLYEIIVTDWEDASCTLSTSLDALCCGSCNDLIVDYVGSNECTDLGTYFAEILINNPGGSNFEFYVDGILEGVYSYGDQVYTFGPFQGDCLTEYEFNIVDLDFGCSSTIDIESVCCQSCNDLIVDYVGSNECNSSGTFFMEVLIDHPTSQSFEVYIGDTDYGTFNYGEEIYTFGPFVGDCTTERYISIQDPSIFCESEITLEPVCCPAFCSISELSVETLECTGDNTYSIILDFIYDGVEEAEFDFWANGSYHNTYAYADIPILISDFPGDPDPFVTVLGIENDQLCAGDLAFEGLDCDGVNCTISNIFAEAYGCDDQGQMSVDIQFNVTNPGSSNQFTINGNGINYGTFEYGELYYTVGPFVPDCNLDYEFVITDVDNNNCSNFIVLNEALCCEEEECNLHTLDGGPECNGAFIVGDWLIDGSYISEVGFDIFVDNVFELFVEYDESDWYSFNLTNPGTANFTLKVCDNDNSLCCIEWELDNPCFDPNMNDCTITGIEAETLCTDDGLFADIWFTNNNPGTSNQFTITVDDQNFGPYEYGESFYNIGPLDSPCDGGKFIAITDVDNNECSGFFDLEFPDDLCCDENQECSVTNLSVETSACNNGTDISIEFELINSSNSVYISLNDDTYGPYNDLTFPLTYISFLFDTEFITVTVCDAEDLDCCASVEVLNPCFGVNQTCEITTLDFGPNPECVNGLITTQWLIDGENLSEVGYDIYINNLFATFVTWNDDSWYDFDIENPGTENFTIKVCDNDNSDCCIEWELDNPCFEPSDECSIIDLGVEAHDCNDNGEIFFDIFFEVNNPGSNNQFSVLGNGNNYGTFEYGQDFYTVGPFDADCETLAELIVTDVNNNDCAAVIEFDEIFCCEANDCVINTLDFGPDPECVNGLIVTEWLIDGENLSEIGFDVFINNEFVTFATWNDNSWYDFDIEDPGTEIFVLKVCDNDNSDCCIEWELDNPCFDPNLDECSITAIEAEALCTDDGLFADIWFTSNNPGSSNQFTISVDDQEFGPYEYGEDFYNLGPLDSPCDEGKYIEITDVDNNDCVGYFDLEIPEGICCDDDAEECSISNMYVEQQECDDQNQVYFTLSFTYENPTANQFMVVGNGNNYGTFVYGVDSYEIGPVLADCETQLEFIITDIENPNCSAFAEHDPVCCENEPSCALSNLIVETTECLENNTFNLILDVEIDDEINDFFDLNINGEFVDFYEFAELPITIENATYDTEYVIVEVCENDNPDCCLILEVMNPCTEETNQNYYINNIEVEFTTCVDDMVTMSLDLDHGDNDDQFTVSSNGISFGNYNYSDLPITVENIPADGVTDYTFSIFDTTIDDLSNSIAIGTLACDGDVILDSKDITLDPANIKSIQAFDIAGKLLGSFDSEENLKILDIDRSVSAGIIILRVDYGTQIVTKKIVRVN